MIKNRIGSLFLLFLSLILPSCNNNPESIILVIGKSSPSDCPDSLILSGELKLCLLNPSKPHDPVKILTDDFFSACSPEVSFDGKSVIFAGRRNEHDTWQIWEMDLRSSKIRQVTSGDENCLFPVYLPDSRVVFSKMMKEDSLKSHLSLFKCNSDGSFPERITFNPASWYAPVALSDGRILAKCIENYPVKGEAELMVLRPDGTKAELFYKRRGMLTGWEALETRDGRIVFTEKTGNSGSGLVSVPYNNPFKAPDIFSGNTGGDFISVSAGTSGNNMLACYRTSPEESYRLFAFDAETGQFDLLYEKKDYDVLDAVPVMEKALPRKLPSEVDMHVKTGLLMCQDVNYPAAGIQKYPGTVKMEILGIDTSLGVIQPEPDGSFYMKIIADMPFRLAALDENGRVIRTCNWIVLRPNERRGCTGCHEEPGIVPENRIPMAVRKDPVLIPVTITSIEEKIVELE